MTPKPERYTRVGVGNVALLRGYRPHAAWMFAALVVMAQTAWAEPPSYWRAYKVADGLGGRACVSVTVAPHGHVLVTHADAEFISELDGYSVNLVASPVSGNGHAYQSPAGQLWTVTPAGLQEFKNGNWVSHPLQEISAELENKVDGVTSQVPLYPVRQGQVLFLLTHGLMEFNAEDPDHPRTEVLRAMAQTQLGEFHSMTVARDGGLWIGGACGLSKAAGPARNLNPQSAWNEFLLPESLGLENLRALEEDETGGVTAVAETIDGRQNAVVYFDGRSWTAQSFGTNKILRAWLDQDQTRWVATGDSLFQVNKEGRAELVQNAEVPTRQIFDVAVEPGGTFWLATAEGLFRHAAPAWRSPPPIQKLASSVRCLADDAQGRLWFVAGGDLHLLEGDLHSQYQIPAEAERVQSAKAIFPLKNGALLVDLGDTVLRFEAQSGEFKTIFPNVEDRLLRPLGLLKDGSVCFRGSDASQRECRLEIYDGSAFQPLPHEPLEAMPCSSFSTMLAARNGDLWFSGDSGIARLRLGKWRLFPTSEKNIPETVVAFVEQADGRIWCATSSRLWEFDGRNWAGARADFGGISGLVRTRDGSLWVASGGSVHRFFQGDWIENGREEGLPDADILQIYEDQRGRVWAATTRGLSLYHPEADPDPPRTSIQSPDEKGSRFPEGATVMLKFSAQDRWKHTPTKRLLYSYRLDERGWSLFQESYMVSFGDLPAGSHSFQVRAMDRNLNVDPKPAQFEFTVVLPWYKEARLLVIAFTGMGVALFFAALAFNRHRRLLQSYAEVERKIYERTRELEIANRELLHSQKMTALGTLAAGLAHDFNNILSIVKGSAQIIEDNVDNPHKIQTRVDRIKMVAEQGAGIVKAMLGFSSASDQQPGPCDLNAVVDDTIRLLGDRFLREVEVRFEGATNLPQVQATRNFIQQILLNLLFNAAESMTSHKLVVISTRRLEKLPAGMVLQPAQATGFVSVSVRDFGCGIPSENLPRIFEPFFTTKALSTRRGTGLGLSMVYELARKMAAGLAVESTVGRGSAFTLILPVQEMPAEAKA